MNASKLILPLLLLLPLSGCFTGVEGTKKVTDKDVKRALSTGSETTAGSALIDIAPRDSVASWPVGKRFYVCDDQARLLFAPNPDYSIDTLHLAGKYLSYKSYKTGSLLDNNSLVTLIFPMGGTITPIAPARRLLSCIAAIPFPFLLTMMWCNTPHRRFRERPFTSRPAFGMTLAVAR